MKNRKTIVGTITWMAGLASLAVVLFLPAAYFTFSYRYLLGSLKSEAEINGHLVTELINTNPSLWRFEQMRLEELLAVRPATGEAESRRIFDRQGLLIAASDASLASPLLKVSQEVFDSGRVAGRIEISRSLRPVALRTGLVGLIGFLGGLALYVVFRILPIRAVLRAEQALRESGEFLARIMQSTTNAILVIDSQGRIVHANQRDSEISGYPPGQLLGMPFAGLFLAPELAEIEAQFETIGQSGAAVLGRESRLRRQDGDLVPVSWGGAKLCGPVGDGGLVFTAEDISRRKQAQEEKEKLILELRNTLAELQTLRGILPICSYCKKIRNEEGTWSQLEAYIHAHSGAQFSHGICPECFKKQLAELGQDPPGE